MTWTKLSDDFGEDTWTLSDQAFRLHVEALVWSNQKLLDGRITKDDIRRFAKNPDAVPELLDHGFWEDEGDAFLIVHHQQHQWTRDQTIAFRQSRVENGKKGGRPPKRNRGANQSGNHSGNQGGSENHSGNQGAKHSENLRGREGKGREVPQVQVVEPWVTTATKDSEVEDLFFGPAVTGVPNPVPPAGLLPTPDLGANGNGRPVISDDQPDEWYDPNCPACQGLHRGCTDHAPECPVCHWAVTSTPHRIRCLTQEKTA